MEKVDETAAMMLANIAHCSTLLQMVDLQSWIFAAAPNADRMCDAYKFDLIRFASPENLPCAICTIVCACA